MKTAVYGSDETELLDNIFAYLVEHGLENITIRELCRGTGYVQGSLYYWFGDKTSIVCESAEYGFKKVTDEVFEYVFKSMENLPRFFECCLDEIGKYKKELRFIYQMTASPVYGKKLRGKDSGFYSEYFKYSKELANMLNCTEEELRPIVYLIISVVLDYTIWEDKETAQMQLDYLYSILPDKLKNRK